MIGTIKYDIKMKNKNITHRWFATKETGMSLDGKTTSESYVVAHMDLGDYKVKGKRVYYKTFEEAKEVADKLNSNIK